MTANVQPRQIKTKHPQNSKMKRSSTVIVGEATEADIKEHLCKREEVILILDR